MSIIYGTAFRNHWGDTDKESIVSTWSDILGAYATYRPSMDFALNNMDSKFVPSALAFRDICKQGPRIPSKPHSIITKQLTEVEKINIEKAKREAMELISKFTKRVVE